LRKSKPNGLSGDELHPSELQSSVEGFRAFLAVTNPAREVLKTSLSVASTAVSRTSRGCVGAAATQDARAAILRREKRIVLAEERSGRNGGEEGL
jgi:hypothetical protein